MKKLNALHLIVITLVTVVLASCASQQPQATNTPSQSPMNRNNNNGLASYMH